MKILALDTSQIHSALSLLEDGKLVTFQVGGTHVAHSEGLLSLIDDLLKNAKVDLSELDAFAVGIGPGSFTGLRIGCATIKSLAQVLNKPIIAFSSLRALRLSVAAVTDDVVAMANAYQGQVFVGWDQREEVMSAEEWCRSQVPSRDSKRIISFCGNGAKTFWSQIKECRSGHLIEWAGPEFITPQGIALAVVEEKRQLTYIQLQANYLRPSQAEMKLSFTTQRIV